MNYYGVLYLEDMGKNTLEIAKKISSFDPDKIWRMVDKVAMP
jgi:hypothetical protein